MRHQFGGPDDGPRNQLRKERHVQCEIDERLSGLNLASINIDCVAKCLERVEGDSDRQDDVQRLRVPTQCGQQRLCRADEEIEILGAIEYLSSNLQSTSENLKSIGDFSYRNEALQDPTTIEQVIKKIQKVTVDQVKEVLNHISEPFIFAYRGDKHE